MSAILRRSWMGCLHQPLFSTSESIFILLEAYSDGHFDMRCDSVFLHPTTSINDISLLVDHMTSWDCSSSHAIDCNGCEKGKGKEMHLGKFNAYDRNLRARKQEHQAYLYLTPSISQAL